MNNPSLIPETRTNKNGVPVVKYVRPNAQESSFRSAMPAPAVNSRDKNQSVFEKIVDSVLQFLMGPPSEDTDKEAEAREVLRSKISELPDRTLKYVKTTWEGMEKRADDGLDDTEFGAFSARVREDLTNFFANDFGKKDHLTEDLARDVEGIVRSAKEYARKYKEWKAQNPKQEPSPSEQEAAPSGFRADEQPQQPSSPHPRYVYDPQVPEPDFVHEGTIHDPRNDQRPHSPETGVGALNDMMSRPMVRDAVDPMLGGSGS